MPDPQRIDAIADIERLKALAATLDAKIATEGATETRLRLRMDYARTLSVLRDRLRRLPEPEDTRDFADIITERWQVSRSPQPPAIATIPPEAISSALPDDPPAPELPPAPVAPSGDLLSF